MKRHHLAVALFLAALSAAGAGQAAPAHRCGWVENPTPGNWWLKDRSGTWTIAEQGGFTADGFDDMPDMSTKGWVEQNGSHGYGCGCIDAETDRATMHVTRLTNATPLPLDRCRADRHLPRP